MGVKKNERPVFALTAKESWFKLINNTVYFISTHCYELPSIDINYINYWKIYVNWCIERNNSKNNIIL